MHLPISPLTFISVNWICDSILRLLFVVIRITFNLNYIFGESVMCPAVSITVNQPLVRHAQWVGEWCRRTVHPLGRRSREVTAWVVGAGFIDHVRIIGVVVTTPVALAGYHRSIPATVVVHETASGVTRTHFGWGAIKKIAKTIAIHHYKNRATLDLIFMGNLTQTTCQT
jgi:hypothetical protein